MTSQPTDEFLNLPDTFPQDDPNLQPGIDSGSIEYPQIPPITVSCRSCERIVGDSSSFICATRHVGGITMETMVSVKLGEVKVTEAEEDEEVFDRYCLYKPIHCTKCDYILGKMYISIAAGVPLSLLNKYTISRTNVLFYIHGTSIPALPPAESEEIMRQLHPEPDDIALTLERVMNLMIYLREEQDGIVRELKRVGAHCGAHDIDLGNGSNFSMPMDGEEKVGNGWKDRISNLEGEVEKLRGILEYVSKGSMDSMEVTKNSDQLTLDEALMGVSDAGHSVHPRNHHLSKRKRIEKPIESNKRPANSSSLLPPKAPPAVPPHQVTQISKPAAKPVIILPSKQKKTGVILEISDSGSESNEGASADEDSEEHDGNNAEEDSMSGDEDDNEEEDQGEDEGEEDEEEETNKRVSVRAPSRRESHVHQRVGKRSLKEQATQPTVRNDKENEKEIPKPGRPRTSLPLGSGGKAAPRLGTRGRRRKA